VADDDFEGGIGAFESPDWSPTPEAWRNDPAFGLTMMSGDPNAIAQHMVSRGITPPGEGQPLEDWASQYKSGDVMNYAPQATTPATPLTQVASAGAMPQGIMKDQSRVPGQPMDIMPPLAAQAMAYGGGGTGDQGPVRIPPPVPTDAPRPPGSPDAPGTNPNTMTPYPSPQDSQPDVAQSKEPGVDTSGQGGPNQGAGYGPSGQEQPQRKAQDNQKYKDKEGMDLGKILAGVSALAPPKPNFPSTPAPYRPSGQVQQGELAKNVQNIVNMALERGKGMRTLGDILRGR